jgi:hypothetical protein
LSFYENEGIRVYRVKEKMMFKYVAVFVGILIMCVPEDTSMLRFAFQGLIGLTIFGFGMVAILDEAEA